MHDHDKEHLLHKLIAGSAFICALCVLPVTQYLLTGGAADTNGQVEGVSTDASIAGSSPTPSPYTAASFSSPEDCAAQRTQDLADLQKYENGTAIAFGRQYDQAAAPYRARLTANAADAEAQAGADAAQEDYLKKLSALESAVSSQKNAIESRSCAAE